MRAGYFILAGFRNRLYNKVYSDELRCTHGFTLKTTDVDEFVWSYVVYYIREKMGSQRSLIQEMFEKKSNEGLEQQAYNRSSLKATEQLLQHCHTEQQNLERALQAALKQEYNETHIDRLQRLLNDNDQEIARLKQVQIESAKRIDKEDRKITGIQVAVILLQELRRNIDTASWAEKRHLLYLLGVKVFIYHTGTITDERGNRWKVRFGWEGLEDIINTASSGGIVNYFP